MPPRSSPKGESKTGLVVTLVLFILLSIGLGVATYYGFAEQEKLTAAAKEAEKNSKIFKDERDWYRGQAWLYRFYIGKAQNLDKAEMGQWKSQFDNGSLPALKGTQKDKDEVSKFIKEDLDKKLGWDPAQNRPLRTYESMVLQSTDDYQALVKKLEGVKTQLATLERKNKDLDSQLQEAQRSYQTALAQLQKKTQDDLSTDRDTIAKLQNDISKLGEKHALDLRAADDARRKVAEESKKKDTLIADQSKRIRKQESIIEVQRTKSAAERREVFHPDWTIVRMDSRGTMPYINLGAADQVKPQLTFSIHGIDVDGKPNPAVKGTLEVVAVLGEHLSQGRVMSVKDPFRDPIMAGDVLHNPSWDPNLKKHIAVAGIIDLSGSGKDESAEFMRNLVRQNAIVDAFLDTRTGKVKGRISVDTDYLIVNDVVDSMSPRDRNPNLEQAMREGIRSMKEEATKNGVQIVGLRKYLDLIGYRLPRHLVDEGNTLYRPGLRPDLSPPVPLDRAPGERPPGEANPPADAPPPLPPADK